MLDSARQGWAERTVKVNTKKLLETLKLNRESHAATYKQAVVDYKEVALEKLSEERAKAFLTLDKNFDLLSKAVEDMSEEEILNGNGTLVLLHHALVQLEVPQDHTHAYDVAIQMAEWEQSETIELLQSQFQCFVMDEWDWKDDFMKLSQTYSGMNVAKVRR